MEKEKIIKRLLENGILVSPEELEKLNGKNIDEFIGKMKEAGAVKTPDKDAEKHEGGAVINIRKKKAKTKLSVKDVAEFYTDKFNKIKGVISEKAEVVSINKLKGIFSDTCIVGMVTELTARGFALQDTTGSIEVVSKHKPEVNDVIGVRGIPREKTFFESEIVFPDIAMNREIGKIKGARAVLAEKISGPVEGANFIISPSPGFKDDKVITDFPNPGFIEIKKNAKEKIDVLVYRPPKEVNLNKAAELLKKRHLMVDKWQIDSNQDNFFIDKVPDVFWVISDGRGKMIYKGVLVVLGKGPVEVDFGTKEVRFL
jgi:DNA polymerase II small subunit/DNA polymerase delta subunit B